MPDPRVDQFSILVLVVQTWIDLYRIHLVTGIAIRSNYSRGPCQALDNGNQGTRAKIRVEPYFRPVGQLDEFMTVRHPGQVKYLADAYIYPSVHPATDIHQTNGVERLQASDRPNELAQSEGVLEKMRHTYVHEAVRWHDEFLTRPEARCRRIGCRGTSGIPRFSLALAPFGRQPYDTRSQFVGTTTWFAEKKILERICRSVVSRRRFFSIHFLFSTRSISQIMSGFGLDLHCAIPKRNPVTQSWGFRNHATRLRESPPTASGGSSSYTVPRQYR